jgi:hypothetical protein
MTKKKSFPLSALATALAVAGPLTLSAAAARAQQAPSPLELVSQLDYECRPITATPPPAPALGIRQLNPVLKDQIPPQVVQLGPAQQLCVPVAKNNKIPTPRALPIVEASDIVCYQATAPWPANVDLKLSHLNPVLKDLPDQYVRLAELQSVCVPVRKNAAQFPPSIKTIVSYVDQACYKLEDPTPSADQPLVLTHLNPVIRAFGFDDRSVIMRRARTMCVPIAKNNEVVPPQVEALVRWADFLKYSVDLVQGTVPVFPLTLTHLNPLFAALPPFPATVYNDPIHLMVPVAKNDHVPPKDADAP